jgi:hypothetical protein
MRRGGEEDDDDDKQEEGGEDPDIVNKLALLMRRVNLNQPECASD